MNRHPLAVLKSAIQAKDTSLCVGLDPMPASFPRALKESGLTVAEQTRHFLCEVVRQTAPHVCAFKAQKAFFDALHVGADLLADLIRFSRETAPAVPFFVDCKIGDIDNTMNAYFDVLFDRLDADGIVVNPYMAADVLAPFGRMPDRLGLVLVRTSNHGAAELQDRLMYDGRPLWAHVLDLTRNYNTRGNLVPIVSCDVLSTAAELSDGWPDDGVIFVAGFGAQSGLLRPSATAATHAVVVNSSRAILYPVANPAVSERTSEWSTYIGDAAREAKTLLNLWKMESLLLQKQTARKP